MATIQIRNVPEDVHQTYRLRAGAQGMSLQEFLLSELIANSSLLTPGELVGEIEERIKREGEEGYSRVSAAEVLAADRQSH